MTFEEAPPDDGWQPRGEQTFGSGMPPQDMEAEQSVLGAMLISPPAIEQATSIVYGSDFYRPVHETIFDCIVDMYTRGEPVDMITVATALGAMGELVKIGGAPYLHTLANRVPIAANVEFYSEAVKRAATFRRLVDAGARIMQRGYSMEGTAENAVDFAAVETTKIEGIARAQDYLPISDLLNERLDELDSEPVGGIQGIATGFLDLDDLLSGLKPGQVIVVAGRPGMGKSTLALDILRFASIRQGLCSCYFSLEMGRTELVNRALAAEARVPLANLVAGRLSESDWLRVSQHAVPMLEAPLFVDDSPNMTMTEIRAKARRLRSQHDLRLIAIDYMQLMSSGRKVENRQVEVSEFSRQIKLLAKELQVPIILLSQLNRGPEQRSNKRPALSDLRESGAIEQDCDVAILLHRDDVYEAESSRPGEADLIVAKHRNGATRDITVAFQGHYSRFVDMARDYP